MRIVPKNWASFQHYKDRSPPWIKLHKALLDDSSFQRLPVASRALAPMLWLLASESKDGSFDASTEELAFRLRTTEREIDAGLKPLIQKGFFLPVQFASTQQADGKRDARPETEGEAEVEGEAEKEPTVLVVLPDAAYRIPNCPHEEIAKVYAELLPMLPQVAVLSDIRKGHITARWRAVCADQKFTREQGIEWFRDYFALVAKSPFLTGNGKPDRATGRVWAADFDWLMLPTNFVKVVEGRYQERRAA